MSSSVASCLAPAPPRLPCSSRATLPSPSFSFTPAPAAWFGPRRRAAAAAPAKGWRPVARVSCLRQGPQDVPTASDDGAGFEDVSRPESSSSRGADANGEEGEGSSGQGEERNSEEGDWFNRAQKIKRNLQERIFRFQTYRWTVPWTGETIAQDHQGGKH